MARLAKGEETLTSLALIMMCNDLETSAPLFCLYICLVLCLAKVRLPLDDGQNIRLSYRRESSITGYPCLRATTSLV